MPDDPRPDPRTWLRRRTPAIILGVSLLAVSVGGVLHASGASHAGDLVWLAATALGVAISLWSMFQSLRQRRLGVDVIALLALVGAVAVREDFAAAIISFMLATGQALENWAAGRARRELSALLARAPTSANRLVNGVLERVALSDVALGDRLVVASGELVPVDGTLNATSATLDESALTGEPLPVEHGPGEWIRSGVVNAGAPFEMVATASAADSTFSGIVRLVSQAEVTHAPFVRMADRFSLLFLGLTLASAAAAWSIGGADRAVAVLVVATPCPMILAAPVAFVAGLSRAAHRNIIVKGGAVLERLARARTVLIDKTGTVTLGHPELVEAASDATRPLPELLGLAASLDQMSPHVVAAAVVRAALAHQATLVLPTDVTEQPGAGIRGAVNGHRVAVGNATWVGVDNTPAWARAARRRARLEGCLSVFLTIDDHLEGLLVFSDPLRLDAARTLRALRRDGVRRIVLVTGDRVDVAETIGAVIGVDQVLAERSPAEKLNAVELESRSAPTIMVGDGINDAPALALADVGVAMGARGASAASEAADVVISVDHFARLVEAIAIARRTRSIALQSMTTGMALSLLAMGAALLGYLPAVAGAILQELIDALVILNALRALRSEGFAHRLSEADSALTRRFHDEHRVVDGVTAQMITLANGLDTLEPTAALTQIRAIYRRLLEDVLPHELAEERELYPAIGRLLGGLDPMGPMSRTHAEISHRVRRLGRLLDDLDDGGVDDLDLGELRSMLYGLNAILDLHTAQEEESYLSLGEELEASSARAD